MVRSHFTSVMRFDINSLTQAPSSVGRSRGRRTKSHPRSITQSHLLRAEVILGELELAVVVVLEPEAEVDIPSQVGMAMFRKRKLLLFRLGMILRMVLRIGANLTVLNKFSSPQMSRTSSKMEFPPRLRVNSRRQRIRL
jgi:hypothetical protein